jgi:small nuclear ribonucleoprotein
MAAHSTMIERPLDLLNESKGKEVLIALKDGTEISGKLTAFDIHINIVLDGTKILKDNAVIKSIGLTFLRGDTILYISPSSHK